MRAYMSDFYYTYAENAFFFREAETKEHLRKLKAEIVQLKEKEPWEVQTFLIREKMAKVNQKDVPIMLDTIFNALGNEKYSEGKV